MEAILTRTFTTERLALLRQFLRFGTVGVGGFIVDTGTVYSLRAWVGLYLAGAVAYVTAATFNWGVNRVWTFRGRGSGSAHRQWALFLAANALGFVLNRGTYFILITVSVFCYAHPVVAIAAGVAMGMFLNFHLSRTVVFR
jgi:putative flippase GtrA